MDPDSLRDKIREDTKAVVLVHIGGIIFPRLNEIRKICEEHKVSLIEDAAHAHGATIDQCKAGSLGDAASLFVLSDEGSNNSRGRNDYNQQ
ncbi:MAG: DegT/DnrJ/EryC1/StrS aminotransferase [Candidatus Gottesmanbacteria bacterium GW2011_GWC2_39_8]|uniref:DegT/DnrJ/EryC1/StrS aminotransferase n=1 Tax=Candidatus Gottesmanbacteria bacterium GW2011_GWC2_39_8 TaxID=1618450 RepID=A0A0G0Q7E4_9BACT|nr:MAG: DegT/DnrJ/EryC1/StrS aminotransferase [Candidatus Gottesmanbacteria bacterium GW2011_GWC2_39_8]